MRSDRIRRFLSFLLCALLLLPFLPVRIPSAALAEGQDDPDDKVIVVSLGDSYASGEGIEPFYGYGESPVQKDWLAHRSIYAWSALLSHPRLGGALGIYRGTNWFFAAASGATTKEIVRTGDKVIDWWTGQKEGEQKKEYGTFQYDFLPGQLDVFYNTPGLDPNDVDYVTITIGGNDVGFTDIIKKAVLNHLLISDLYKKVTDELNHFYDKTYKKEPGTYYKLYNTYKRIADAAPNATILVAGYPELLDENGGAWLLFDREDCAFINKAVRLFNSYIESLVRDCQREGMKIQFCSVTEEFKGHQAYSQDPYINPIYLGPLMQPQDLTLTGAVSAYSMHPNYDGARAYARCVQKVINALEAGQKNPTGPTRQTSDKRDIVLILDSSGSMDGVPMTETKKAAQSFVRTILQEDASIGVVSFASDADMNSDFSTDEEYLTETVSRIYAYGKTNTDSALTLAEEMLDNSSAQQKYIVLMSDGLPNLGRQGDSLIRYADTLKEKGILIYTLGFFQKLYSYELYDAQNLMEGIASDSCHFEVENASDLTFFFQDIGDQINGVPYIYIRVACPVDVRVEYNGEILSSTGNTRTSFGTMTFEESENSYSRYGDDRTKILRLREGADYKIEISGNGEGTMDYTVSFVDENGKYTDQRKVEDVPVTSSTVMESNALRDKRTILDVDEDGDGKFDRSYDLGGPAKEAKKEPLPVWAWVLIGVGGAALIGAVILVLVVHGKKKRSSDGKGPRGSAAPINAPVFTPTPKATAGETPRFCRRCGKPIDGISRFCIVCGAPLETAAAGKPLPKSAPAAPAARETVTEDRRPVSPRPASLWKPAAEDTGFAAPAPKPIGEAPAVPEPSTEKPAGVLRSSMRTNSPTMTLFRSESAASAPEPLRKESPASAPAETAPSVEPPAPDPMPAEGTTIPAEEAPRPAGRAKFCLRCGEPVEEGAKFCLNCREPIEADEASAPETPAEPPEAPAPRPAGRAKFCLHCGEPVEEGAKFCLNCGEKL